MESNSMLEIAKAATAAADILRRLGWTTEVYARDANNREAPIRSSSARKFCAQGAILATNTNPDVFLGLTKALREIIGVDNISSWNDSQLSAEPVIAAFERIARVYGKEPL